jgi:hypothetical protein
VARARTEPNSPARRLHPVILVRAGPLLLMTAALTLVLAACASGDPEGATPDTSPRPSDSAQPSPHPTAKPSPTRSPVPGSADTFTGTLGADTAERGCTYLQAPDGTRYEVLYPDGWRIQAAPLRLANPDGEVVATGGETITVQGSLAREARSICQLGPIFEAVEVVSID